MSVQGKVQQFSDDVNIAHQIIHGDATTTVTTQGGPVRSMAKLLADNQSAINAQLQIGTAGGAAIVGFTPSAPLVSTTVQAAITEVAALSGGNISAALAAPTGTTLLGTLAAGIGAIARTVQARLRDQCSARDFGAIGDGVADDTAALQAFATHICLTGKKGYIPAGKYKITSQVTFANNCYIHGDGWKDVRDMTGPTTRSWASAQIVGTIIYAAYTSSTSPAAFYFTGNSCVVRDIEFEALQPLPGAGWTSNATPYAISTFRQAYYEQGGNGLHVENVMLRNFKNGIHMQGTSRGVLRNVYGQCFGQAISVTQCGDVLRIEDVHLNWPFYSGQADVVNYMNANADALVLGRVDNPIVHNFFTFGGRSGIMTYVDTDPTFGGKTERFQGTNIGIDNVQIGLYLTDTVTMSIANFYVYNRAVAGSRGIYNPSVIGGGQVPIRLSLTNGDFQGSQSEAMRFEVPGTVLLSNIVIRDYNNGNVGANGIAVFSGVALQYANVTNDTVSSTTLFQANSTGTISSGAGSASGVSAFNTRTGAVTLTSADVTSALTFTPYNASNPSAYVSGYDAAKTHRSTASTTPASGVGVELNWDTGLTAGFLTAYDRTNTVYKDLNVGGNTITFKAGPSGTNAALFDANQCFIVGYGTTQGSAIKLQVNGTALFGGAVTMPTAAVGSNTTIGATTAFVTAAVAAGGGSSGVSSFNARTGAVSLSSADVTGALSFTPYNASNPSGYLSSITSSQVTGALGFTPYNSTNPSGYLTSVSYSQVTSALGYTPYNSSNPSAYVSGYDAAKTHRSTASTTPASGVGVELNWDTSSNAGFINAYDRSANTYQNLNIGGLSITFKSGSGGANVGAFDTNGSLLVGYGATNGSTYKLQVNSQIYATSATIATSDRRVKMNIEALGDATAIVMALVPVTYEFRPHEIHNFPAGTQIGFIAQDVETALSGMAYCAGIVSTNDDGGENLKGLAEAKLIPLLVKAFQELQSKFDAYVSTHP